MQKEDYPTLHCYVYQTGHLPARGSPQKQCTPKTLLLCLGSASGHVKKRPAHNTGRLGQSFFFGVTVSVIMVSISSEPPINPTDSSRLSLVAEMIVNPKLAFSVTVHPARGSSFS